MATKTAIAIRRDAALHRVASAVAVIGQEIGVVVEAFPSLHKYSELQPAIEAEWMAESLEAIASTLSTNTSTMSAIVDQPDKGIEPPESLMGRTKADLESLAAELGIETGKLKTKAEIVDAILGAKTATGEDA